MWPTFDNFGSCCAHWQYFHLRECEFVSLSLFFLSLSPTLSLAVCLAFMSISICVMLHQTAAARRRQNVYKTEMQPMLCSGPRIKPRTQNPEPIAQSPDETRARFTVRQASCLSQCHIALPFELHSFGTCSCQCRATGIWRGSCWGLARVLSTVPCRKVQCPCQPVPPVSLFCTHWHAVSSGTQNSIRC